MATFPHALSLYVRTCTYGYIQRDRMIHKSAAPFDKRCDRVAPLHPGLRALLIAVVVMYYGGGLIGFVLWLLWQHYNFQ